MVSLWQNFKYALAYTVLAFLALLSAFVVFPGVVIIPAFWLADHVYLFVGIVYGLLSFTTVMSIVITLCDRGILNRWLTSAEELIERLVMR